MKELKKEIKGITLIALVVTIIVLLILAGIAISLTIGNNGLFTRAQNATNTWKKAEINEQEEMSNFESLYDETVKENGLDNSEKNKIKFYVSYEANKNIEIEIEKEMTWKEFFGNGDEDKISSFLTLINPDETDFINGMTRWIKECIDTNAEDFYANNSDFAFCIWKNTKPLSERIKVLDKIEKGQAYYVSFDRGTNW